MRSLTRTVACLLVLFFGGAAASTTIYVPGDYTTIQAALDVAVGGDTVVVAQGTYTGAGNNGLDFNGKAITLRSTDPTDPDVVDATIINGGGSAQAIDFADGEGHDTVVAGFTFTNCYAETGGAIAIHDAGPTISDCVFVGNSAYSSGGAIFCTSYGEISTPLILDCVFDGNTAKQGGAIYCTTAGPLAGSGNLTTPEIADCLFTDNSAVQEPGAGGAVNLADSDADVQGCTFTGNTAATDGGALDCWGTLAAPGLSVQDCVFGAPDGANSAQAGGAVAIKVAVVAISGCVIRCNEASAAGGGVYAESGASLTLKDTTIAGNAVLGVAAVGGGGMCIDGSYIAPSSGCTISDNTSATYGGGVRMTSTQASLRGFLLEGNSAVYGGGGIYADGGPDTLLRVANSTITLNEVTMENPGENEGHGGGICCIGILEVGGCTVGNNVSAGDGGGVYSNFVSVHNFPAFVTDTVFAENVAHSGQGYRDGGALYISGGDPVVQNCTFTGNEAANGGGVYIISGGTPTIANCTIGGDTQDDGNTASGFGGGVYIAQGTPMVVGCRIKHNRTTANGNGGGVYSAASSVVESCIVEFNSTAGTGNGGGLCVSDSEEIFNCLIVHNTAGGNGGGAWCATGDATFRNCTFNANEAVDGGALYLSGATPLVKYCILWGDTATGIMGVDEISPLPAPGTTSYCDIENGPPGLGNLDDDPLFVSGPNHDYYLSHEEIEGQGTDSPCIDAGDVASSVLGLDKFTTRTDERVDTGWFVDLGYHDPGTTAVDDVYWDQATTSIVLTFTAMESLGEDPLEYTVEYVDGDEYWSGLGWSELTTVTGMGSPTTVTDDLTTNPLTGAFRFYRVRRADGLAYSPETAAVFELELSASPSVHFISTPLIPDPDHDEAIEIFGEGAARQVPRNGFQVSDLDEVTGAISRIRWDLQGDATVIAGSAFDIEAGPGYEVFMGFGPPITYTVRLTGYVPDADVVVPMTKFGAQSLRWFAYSMPRPTTLGQLGLEEAVTPWVATNRVRLLPLDSNTWINYQYNTTGGYWYEVTDPDVPVDPDLVCGMGAVFLRFGPPDASDALTLSKWYLHPPNVW